MKTHIIFLLAIVLFMPIAQAASLYQSAAVHRVISEDQPLPADYIPADLVRAADYGIVTKKSADIDEMKIRLAQDVGSRDPRANMPSRLRDLMYLCEQQTGELSQLGSGYRSYDKQRIVYWNHRFDGQAALPGTSEHQAGLAADISIGGAFLTKHSATFTCFSEHAWKYGFMLSYPEGNSYLQGKSITEPWHWRYVGLEAARLAHDFGKKDYPAEFLAKLHYFRWLDNEALSETIPSLRLALAKLHDLKKADSNQAWFFGRQVSFMSTRVMAQVAVR